MKKFFASAFFFLTLTIFSANVNAAANWIWVYSDEYVSIWIDNNSIGRDGNVFFAYFKETYSDAGVNRIIESRRSDGLHIRGYHNLSDRVSFQYFKNSGGIKYMSIMGSVDYDKNGSILNSWQINRFYWDRIIPGSYGEAKYDAAYARVIGR